MPRRELILGGQRSGKSRRGETLAAYWLARSPGHRAVLLATARAEDDEMRARIERHRSDRALRVPALRTVEEPLALAAAIRLHSDASTLVLVDCLTLWLTHRLMPAPGWPVSTDEAVETASAELVDAVRAAQGPLLLVGNEIGLGVVPLGPEVRRFVDALGRLNQQVAAACDRVTLMVAGLPMHLKGDA